MTFWDAVTMWIFIASASCLAAIQLRRNGIWGIPTMEQLSSPERKTDLKLILAAIILFAIGMVMAFILKHTQVR